MKGFHYFATVKNVEIFGYQVADMIPIGVSVEIVGAHCVRGST